MTDRVLASTWLALEFAALCLSCDQETIFDIREGECPTCGRESFALLARWLRGRAHPAGRGPTETYKRRD